MLNKNKTKVIIFILLSLIALINSQACSIVEDTDIVNQDLYSSLYRIPYSKITAYAAGGETTNNPLSKALDNNWSTVWISLHKNGENFTSSTGVVNINFINSVEFTFSQTATVDRLVYQSENKMSGYPTELLIYYAEKENDIYVLLDNITSTKTNSKVKFTFSKAVTCKKIKLVYLKSNGDTASAAEFNFYQPDYNQTTEVYNLFSDYAETVVKKEITFEYLNSLQEIYKNNINYDTEIFKLIDRAKKYLSGTYIFDPRREFSTNPKAKNVIRRNGDIKSYMYSKLRMVWAGNNKQATGIFGLSNEKITVYLTAKSTDKLPKIKFSQNVGHWGSWQSSEFTLSIGKNVYTFPYFINQNYASSPVPGGPIYIINPYTEDEQSEEVKIYIEDGYFFPFYEKGKNENDFYNYLSQYMLLMEKNSSTYMDLLELWGERMLLTVDAKRAYDLYKDGTKSVNHSMEVWDEYLKYLYRFNGVKYEKNEQYYNKINYWCNNNVRYMQPFGGATAYAINEHVGIYTNWTLGVSAYSENVQTPGWLFGHEIGHTMDISERVVGEVTNNMEAKYGECNLERKCTNGDYEKNLVFLTPDVDDDSLRYNNGPYWTTGGHLFWWQIETLYPGFWGKLDNMYRYNDTTAITKSEKQVYFASIILGINMSYYYERYSFRIDATEPNFKYYNTSQTFKDMMQQLANEGKITNKVIKFWYLINSTYTYNIDNNFSDNSSCYRNNKKQVNIIKVLKTDQGYSLTLPETTCEGHLGYEIYENDKVINFTLSTIFEDKLKYDDNYIPKYKIRAYDKLLEYTELSEAKSYSYEKGSKVCVYNNQYYDSIAEAVSQIPTNTDSTYEITLKKNTKEGSQIEIKANIIIKLDESSSEELTIFKELTGNLFNVNSNKNLTLVGNNENVKLILDGGSTKQIGSLISNSGILKAKYTKFINSINNQPGGAICSISSSKLYVYDSLFENNKGQNGGAISVNSAKVNAEISNSIFRKNTATLNGGGIFNRGTIKVLNCLIENNIAIYNGAGLANNDGGIATVQNTEILNNKANENGGGIYVDGKINVKKSTIKNNIALGNGGGACQSGGYTTRSLYLEDDSIINNNTATNGGGFCLLKGYAYYYSVSIYDNKVSNLGSNTYLGSESPKLFVKSKNNKLEGEIYKNSAADLIVQNEIFSLYQENQPIKFSTDYNNEEVLLIKKESYTITDDDLKLLSPTIGTLFLSSDNEIWVRINTYTLTYKSGTNTTEVKCVYGEKVTINYVCQENQYVSKISDNKGKIYNIGDNITIYDSMTLEVEVKDLYEITLDYIDKKVKYFSKQNSDFYFPNVNNTSKDSLDIYFWTDEKGNQYFDKASITKTNMSFSANYAGYLYVKIDYEDKRLFYNLTGYNEYNTTFVIPKLDINVPEDYELNIKFDGNKYKSGDTIYINKNVNLVAKLSKKGSEDKEDSGDKEDKDDSKDSQEPNKSDSHVFAIVFSIIGVIVLIVVIFFVYRFIRIKTNKSKLEVTEGVGLLNMNEL